MNFYILPTPPETLINTTNLIKGVRSKVIFKSSRLKIIGDIEGK